ncbi:hypothetical protein G9A89_005789 [Geosiphon pyriformis]|nr:hypothetical protein G9A89_005789 [Geosiphon pyriformis]
MDGSLCSLGTVNIKTDMAVFFEDIGLGLGVRVFGLALSIIIELQAIALALECVLPSSLVSWYKVKEHSGISENEVTNALAGSAFLSGLYLSYQIKEHFIRTGGGIVSGNSRHFIHDVFQSVCQMCWEVGSNFRVVLLNAYVDE